MSLFVGWDSQPLDDWAQVHPPGYMVKLNGRKTHFVKKGDGPPVVLIHGFNLDHNTWIENMDVLARYFTVYAVDLWGSGFSTREPLDYGFPLFVEEIQQLMDHLKLARAHLVGHSMGGGTAIAFSVAHPNRVDRLVLVDSVGIPRPTTPAGAALPPALVARVSPEPADRSHPKKEPPRFLGPRSRALDR